MKNYFFTLLAGLLVAGPLFAQLSFTDNFNRANTASQTSASVPNAIGDDYTITQGSWRISNNILEAEFGGGRMYQDAVGTLNTNGYSFTLTADVFSGGYDDDSTELRAHGLLFNFQDDTNWYALRFRTNRNSDAIVQLQRRDSSGLTTLQTVTTPDLDRFVYYTVNISSSETTAGLFNWSIADGSTVVVSDSFTDTTHTDGYSGFWSVGDDVVTRYDNYSVTVVPEPATYALIFALGVGAFVLVRRRFRS